MDAIGVPYLYEAEAYNLGKLNYLPDFYLTSLEAFFEVKSPIAGELDWKKIHALATLSGRRVYIATGPPEMMTDFNWQKDGVSLTVIFDDLGSDQGHLWCQCPNCGRTEIQYDGFADRIKCGCPRPQGRFRNYDSEQLKKAYAFSKAHRFEPGS